MRDYMYLIILKTALAGRVNNSKQIMEKLSSKGFFVLKSIVGKMDADGYMPLVAEKVGEGFWADIHLMQLSLAHYDCNGDLMADPEMMFFSMRNIQWQFPFLIRMITSDVNNLALV
ncbi:hypothetical protein DWX15_17885 [Bacteroides sp. AF18-33]|uniref:DUF6908 domain-containing protein n=2 Tax=Bacteroides TaxID=816 RepID=A0A412B4U9_BACUN|nr:hypothetical protein [Bacteroides uniformis]RGQ47535.1 hypothetical protein DWY92_19165 [Bacteroides uniformis]RJV49374.1 hypothetical protein DWX15_17885 [Bacteroides sp. AF18-33]